jgi:hypothetical protein
MFEADVARMKLRALKTRKHISAEETRRQLAERIKRFRAERGMAG